MDIQFVIYCVKCGPYYYIGSTKNATKRKSRHLEQLTKGSHFNPKLQNVYNKYKEYNYSIIYVCIDQSDMEIEEANFIKLYKEQYGEYCTNLLDVYGGGSSWRQYKTPEELKVHDDKRINLSTEKRKQRNEAHKNTIKNTPQHIKDERMKRKIESSRKNIKNRKNYTPIHVTFIIPNECEYSVVYDSESEFFKNTKLEETSIRELKTLGVKTIKRRLHWTKHNYPIGTIIILNQT